MNIRPLFSLLLVVTIVLAFMPQVHAETFVLRTGEIIEGVVVRSAGKTLSIKLPERGMRQLPISEVDHFKIRLNSGEFLTGKLIGWSSLGYEIQAADRLLSVKDGELAKDVAAEAARVEKINQRKGVGGPRITLSESEKERKALTEPRAESVDTVAAVPMLTGSSTPVAEDDGDAIFHLDLSRSSAKPVAVIYSAIDRAAKNGTDYLESSGVAIIDAGKMSTDVSVPIINDDLAEPDEEFELFLTVDPQAARIDDRSVVTIIRDDDS